MSTECELQLFCPKPKADRCAQAIVKEAKRIEKKYSFYNPSSVLSRINTRENQILDQETKNLLQMAKHYYEVTGGLFDVTVATLKVCYRYKTTKELETCLKSMLPYVGAHRFKVVKNKIIFDNPYTKIDLGGFAKEYAVDRALLEVKKMKIPSAIINFGGDIYIHGKKPDLKEFKIGIKDPRNPQRFIKFLELSDCAVTTSAHYERSITIEGRSHSHIISPRGFSKALSTTVIAPSALEAGVYSTALSIEGCLASPHRVLFIY